MKTMPAPLWRRFAALLYDSFILLAISMLYGALVTLIYVMTTGNTSDNYQPMMDGWWFQLGWVLSLVSFYLFFWYRGGQTVGMRAWRLRLVSANQAPLSAKQCLLRAALAPFCLAACGLGYFWAWIDQQSDCLHDKLSHTRVLLLPKKP